MIPFRGNLSIQQYVKGKPHPSGVKVFYLCGKGGISYDFLVYQGSKTTFADPKIRQFGLGAAVVLNLTQHLCDVKGHKLFFDDFFFSYHLFQILKCENISAAGTIRINRTMS
ncbi:Uncharacterised protein at_DN0606 [Pycnogonum litorale]